MESVPAMVRRAVLPASEITSCHRSMPVSTGTLKPKVTTSFTPSPFGEKKDWSMVSWIGVSCVSTITLSSCAAALLPARSVAVTR
jgi:hypothetical protein